MASIKSNTETTLKNNDFVIKLRLVGVGGTPQIRRVLLPRIVLSGELSYNKLVALAIDYTFPEESKNPEEYDVTLSYYDEDNDCITIASTEELADAIGQFSAVQPPVLRLTTDVKLKKKAMKKASNTSPPLSPTGRNYHGSQKQRGGQQAQAPIHVVLESFVTALATAAATVQEHIKPNANSNRGKTTGSKTPAGESPSASPKSTERTDVSNKSKEEDHLTKEAKLKRLFIHGRHTCDGCLCTPVIGTRYKASNVPDYDLCTKCFGNYKGTDIHFEPAALDRDAPFQERWHRRRTRWVSRRGSPRTHSCRGHRHFVAGPIPPETDSALKEAIRLSLRGVPKSCPLTKEPVTEEGPGTTVEAVSSSKMGVPVSEVLERPEEESKKVKNAEPKKNVSSEHNSFSQDAEGNGEAAEALGYTLDECAKAIDDMVSELTREPQAKEIEERNIEDREEEDFSALTNSVPSLIEPPIYDQEWTQAEILVGPEEECMRVSDTPVDAIILGSSEKEQPDDKENNGALLDDEWQVVTEDSQVAGDEMLAQAFHLLGSALYQSDMSRPENAKETVMLGSGSGSPNTSPIKSTTTKTSSPSSVLSFVPSIDSNISVAVLARWPAQLAQLRELGFEDEHECVDVLERLHAANVGVDSTEEVTVAQVVNAMLKNE